MKLLILLSVTFAYFFGLKAISTLVTRIGSDKGVHKYRISYIKKILSILLTIVFVAIILLGTGIALTEFSLFISSFFAVLGVALFAQWSILSNITASVIIFFFFPYRVGSLVKIIDADDNDVSGIIEEITLFHVIIQKDDNLITYPNSLILQKAVIKLDAITTSKTE